MHYSTDKAQDRLLWRLLSGRGLLPHLCKEALSRASSGVAGAKAAAATTDADEEQLELLAGQLGFSQVGVEDPAWGHRGDKKSWRERAARVLHGVDAVEMRTAL